MQKFQEERHRNGVLARAVAELRDIMSQPAHVDLGQDFTWLTDYQIDNTNVSHFVDVLAECSNRSCSGNARKALVSALTNIKYSLFTPFKVDSQSWPTAAFQLLTRHSVFTGASVSIAGTSVTRTTPPISNDLDGCKGSRFPCSYATLLTFLRDFS